MSDGASDLGRVRQIEADVIGQDGEFDWEKLSEAVRDEWDSLCVSLDQLEETGMRRSEHGGQAHVQPIGPAAWVERIREGFLGHLDAMFSVLDELDWPRGGRRTRLLSNRNWRSISKMHKELGGGFHRLLLLGIVYHDIGKLAQWDIHADVGGKMIDAIAGQVCVSTMDLGTDPARDADGIPPEQEAELLKLLVRYHDVYGNFFTGEQSLVGCEPIALAFRRDSLGKHLDGFLDTLVLLTVAEVGSLGEDTFLYNGRVRRYLTASEEIRRWVRENGNPDDGEARSGPRDCFMAHASTPNECAARVVGLTHSFSPKIDQDGKQYEKSVNHAMSRVFQTKSKAAEFASSFARIRKLMYALRWFEQLSGELRDGECEKPSPNLEKVVRLLWILTRPAANIQGTKLIEIRFPSSVDDHACARLERQLGDESIYCRATSGDLPSLATRPWTPLPGLSVTQVKESDDEMVLECCFHEP